MDKEKVLYIDAANGLSGDMILAALLDLGFPEKKLFEVIRALKLPKEIISINRVNKNIFQGINITYKSDIRYKKLDEFKELIKKSNLKDKIRKNAQKMIEEMFKIESIIHKKEIGFISLHEMSNIDLIIEICGILEAIDYFSPVAIYSSIVNIGQGIVNTEHGKLSVPAPATLLLIKDIPVFNDGTNYELLTPTGALIIKNLVDTFCQLPSVKILKVGCGIGSANIPNHNNIVRIFLCELLKSMQEKVIMIETNIDNCSSELLADAMEKLLNVKALDVFFTPIYMKKNRPAYRLNVICNSEDLKNIFETIFREIPTLGLRYWECNREILKRRIIKVNTEYGKVRVKESFFGGKIINVNPEYEDCKKISNKTSLPLNKVYNIILNNYYNKR